jgi:type II secretory pathway component PulF
MSKQSSYSDWLRPLRTLGIKKQREYFLENFAMLVHSGMSILEALESMRSDLRGWRMKSAVDTIRESVRSGSPLWKGFKQAGIFPPHVIALVRIGEDTGQLPDNLEIVARQQKKERRFRSKLYTAMMYPAFVLGLTLLVGVGVAWFILPNLASVFSNLQMELPAITRWLIATGEFIGQHGPVVIPAFLVVVFAVFFVVFIFPPTKHIGQRILFFLPGTKQLIREIELSRFGYLLGSLLGSGVVITESLDSLASATTFRSYERLYRHMRQNVLDGYSLEECFGTYDGNTDRLIPGPVRGMVVAGEQSGNLPDTLHAIGENFETKLDSTAKNLTTLLEPILLFVVWIGVVAVALAVILPIYSLVGNLNKQTDDPATAGGPPKTKQVPAEATEATTTPPAVATSSPPSTTSADQPSDTEPETAATTTANRLEVTPTGLGYLNVRAGPSTRREQVDRVTPGDVFVYTQKDGRWYRITIEDGQSGWVYGEYVNLLSNADDN